MDIFDLHRLCKIADSVTTTAYQVPAGAIMATKVTLNKVVSQGLEDTETLFVVVRAGNPGTVVVATEDEAEAHRAYADQIDDVRKVQSERVMYRR